uniref:Uncharacterized protein n=1 Tax=Nelumbo nucifera TaxID=4432 RepID=A0A822YP93_NELNU|nr:TPA_asm: hypothetical protein HUJ06_011676 [Nelumbo nucifera]
MEATIRYRQPPGLTTGIFKTPSSISNAFSSSRLAPV